MGKVGELYVGGDNHIRLPSWYSSRGDSSGALAFCNEFGFRLAWTYEMNIRVIVYNSLYMYAITPAYPVDTMHSWRTDPDNTMKDIQHRSITTLTIDL
jgi:hypothetical protein